MTASAAFTGLDNARTKRMNPNARGGRSCAQTLESIACNLNAFTRMQNWGLLQKGLRKVNALDILSADEASAETGVDRAGLVRLPTSSRHRKVRPGARLVP